MMKKNKKTVTSIFLDSAWDWSPGTLFPGYRIGHVAELMIATSGKNDADDFHDECYIAPPSAGNLPATTTILRRSRAEMAIGKQFDRRIQGHSRERVWYWRRIAHLPLPRPTTPISSKCNLAPNFPTRIRSDPGQKKEKKGKKKFSLARFQLSRHTTHKRTKKKKVNLHGDVPPTFYLLPFSLTFYFFFLHMHACMPAEQKKAQDRKKKKEISNRNCKAGNLDTACRLPLQQELINTCLPPVPVHCLPYFHSSLFENFFSFLGVFV